MGWLQATVKKLFFLHDGPVKANKKKEANIYWSFIMLQGLCQQNLLYFSLQHDKVSAVIIPRLQVKKGRLGVNVTCESHSLVNSNTGMWTKVHGAVHRHYKTKTTLVFPRLYQGPELGTFWSCKMSFTTVIFPFQLPLSYCDQRFYNMYDFVQPTLRKQTLYRLETQTLMRHSCFPSGANTLE